MIKWIWTSQWFANKGLSLWGSRRCSRLLAGRARLSSLPRGPYPQPKPRDAVTCNLAARCRSQFLSQSQSRSSHPTHITGSTLDPESITSNPKPCTLNAARIWPYTAHNPGCGPCTSILKQAGSPFLSAKRSAFYTPRERIFIELRTSDRKVQAPVKGSK